MLTVGIIFHELSFLHPWRYALETAHILFGVIGFFFLWFVWAADFGTGFKYHPDHHLAERLLAQHQSVFVFGAFIDCASVRRRHGHRQWL